MGFIMLEEGIFLKPFKARSSIRSVGSESITGTLDRRVSFGDEAKPQYR
jgi:hypothetical protein